MWQILKAELIYNRLSYLLFSIIMITIQGMEIIQKSLNYSRLEQIINSNNVLFFAVFFFMLSIYKNRTKENQIRFLSILPLSNINIATIRFWSSIIPFIIILIYLIISHFFVLFIWQIFTAFHFDKIGVMLIALACLTSTNDSWFSDSNIQVRAKNILRTIIIFTPIILIAYCISPVFYKNIPETSYRISKIVFLLLGVIAMLTTIFSYQKRKSYLS